MKESNILHCDLNNFFASVECVKNPDLKLVPMAVCGDPKLRHGIILAKNDIAKKYGVVTAETIYSARKKCHDLVLIDSSYEDYTKYSKLVNNIYLKYTNKVEPLSIDESYLDISESIGLFGDSIKIANLIKEDVKKSTGLTISIGVSFNKSFAKIGSDMKKPDAITVIDYNNFKRILYPQNIDIIMSIGKNTKSLLNKYGIFTVGDLAHAQINKLRKILGNKADEIYSVVNGNILDCVKDFNKTDNPKSVSKGCTFDKDTNDIDLLNKYINDLCEMVSKNLRKYNLKCTVVCIGIKDCNFVTITRQKQINSTNSYSDIVKVASEILKENYDKNKNIRSLTVFANNLVNNENENKNQIDLFNDLKVDNNIKDKDMIKNNKLLINENINKKKEKINTIIDNINKKYGNNSITYASTSYIKNDKNK